MTMGIDAGFVRIDLDPVSNRRSAPKAVRQR
jgi:hypothetical protein